MSAGFPSEPGRCRRGGPTLSPGRPCRQPGVGTSRPVRGLPAPASPALGAVSPQRRPTTAGTRRRRPCPAVAGTAGGGSPAGGLPAVPHLLPLLPGGGRPAPGQQQHQQRQHRQRRHDRPALPPHAHWRAPTHRQRGPARALPIGGGAGPPTTHRRPLIGSTCLRHGLPLAHRSEASWSRSIGGALREGGPCRAEAGRDPWDMAAVPAAGGGGGGRSRRCPPRSCGSPSP